MHIDLKKLEWKIEWALCMTNKQNKQTQMFEGIFIVWSPLSSYVKMSRHNWTGYSPVHQPDATGNTGQKHDTKDCSCSSSWAATRGCKQSTGDQWETTLKTRTANLNIYWDHRKLWQNLLLPSELFYRDLNKFCLNINMDQAKFHSLQQRHIADMQNQISNLKNSLK